MRARMQTQPHPSQFPSLRETGVGVNFKTGVVTAAGGWIVLACGAMKPSFYLCAACQAQSGRAKRAAKIFARRVSNIVSSAPAGKTFIIIAPLKLGVGRAGRLRKGEHFLESSLGVGLTE